MRGKRVPGRRCPVASAVHLGADPGQATRIALQATEGILDAIDGLAEVVTGDRQRLHQQSPRTPGPDLPPVKCAPWISQGALELYGGLYVLA